MTTSRREFLSSGLAAGAALPWVGNLAPRWLHAAPRSPRSGGPILVIVQCRGAYDFLHMLPPADHPTYLQGRPNLAIPRNVTLPVESGLTYYWAPAMQTFKDLYDRGDLALVLNIGYPNPNLSHFESEKKWFAGDPAITVLQRGWLARWLDVHTGSAQIPAVDLESRLNEAFSGARVPVMTDLDDFEFVTDPRTNVDELLELMAIRQNAAFLRPTADPDLQYVADGIVGAANDSALLRQAGASYTPAATYPGSRLGSRLSLAASLIIGGLGASTYVTNIGGYDTHANQGVVGAPHTGTQADRQQQMAEAVKAFLDDVAAQGCGQDVVVMVFSEFSRRVYENGSVGTDHGHGNVAFLAGQPVQGGRYGTYPDISPAMGPSYYVPFDQNSIDFRSLYATVLERWLGVSSSAVLGGSFPLLGAL